MKIEVEKDSRIPEQGDNSDLFERIFNYISNFDNNWINRIQPAAEEDINLLTKLSGIEKIGLKLPQCYQIFLNYMGEKDGGILTGKEGSCSIKEIIKLYQEIHKYEPENLNPQYLLFFNVTLGSQIAFDLGSPENPNLVDFDCGKAYEVRSESLEKLIFESIFFKYVKDKYTIYFGGSGNSLNKALSKNRSPHSNIFKIIEETAEQYNFKKVWISEEERYFGINETASIYIWRNGLKTGVGGHITGVNRKDVLELSKLFAAKVGAKIGKLYIKK